jgi:alcohol oxidase
MIYPDAEEAVHIVRASRLIVVAAGALGSPCILERSGIGAASVLERAGVASIIDLPGVGEHYQGKCHRNHGTV